MKTLILLFSLFALGCGALTDEQIEQRAAEEAATWAAQGRLAVKAIHCASTGYYKIPCSVFLEDGRVLPLDCSVRKNRSVKCQLKVK